MLLATPVKKWNSGRNPVMPTKSHTPAPLLPSARPGDATLTVKKAARVLGVHPNTVRAWSDAGRLRYYRINDRGDRRYRLHDLQRFLAAAESGAPAATDEAMASGRVARRDALTPAAPTLSESAAGLDLLADLAEVASFPSGLDPALDEACRRIRLATGAALVGIWERRPGGLVPHRHTFAPDQRHPRLPQPLRPPPPRANSTTIPASVAHVAECKRNASAAARADADKIAGSDGIVTRQPTS